MMPLSHRLPRPENRGQAPPRSARAAPPRDSLRHQPVITEPVAPLILMDGQTGAGPRRGDCVHHNLVSGQ